MHHLTGQNKAALARYDYAPYGELMRNAGLPLTVGYTGHHWDAAIGQYYAPFRYYNPQTARWNMRDPLGMIDGPNMYAYVAEYFPHIVCSLITKTNDLFLILNRLMNMIYYSSPQLTGNCGKRVRKTQMRQRCNIYHRQDAFRLDVSASSVSGPEVPVPGVYAIPARMYRPGRSLL